jgi:3-deoxy-D-manno-octulosonic-acid transferase
MLSSLYRLLTDLGAPFINFYLYRRRLADREDRERFAERLGGPSRPRPVGRLIWCHAASVGEAMSLLLLIEKLHDIYPDMSVLMTTGTVTAARMIMPRLPPYAVHQYMPIDRVPCITRFLNHWKPMAALWIESEIWPNTLALLKARMIPVILLNARMSENSFRNWRRVKSWAREIMSAFSLCLAQTEDDRGRFIALGARPVKCLGNLKYASAPLPYSEQELIKLRDEIAERPIWLMASTHRGEEEVALAAHQQIAATRPDLLTIIVPRHTARGDEIAHLIKASGLSYARRSKNDAIHKDTQIYLADTMSELGLFYRLCPITVIGGSFVPIGGHNPIEAAQFESAIIFGPHMFKTKGLVQEFLRAEAALQLQHANELAFAVDRLMTLPDERKKQAQTARLLADQKRHILDQIIDEMAPWLKS